MAQIIFINCDYLTNITTSALTLAAHDHKGEFVLITKTYINVVEKKNDDPYIFSKRLENFFLFSIEVEKRAPLPLNGFL